MSRYFDDELFHSDDPYLKQSNGKYWFTNKGKKVSEERIQNLLRREREGGLNV